MQVLTVGPHSGKKVQEAKRLIQGEMVVYQEPERTVTTRSGDQCVVALTDQWWVRVGVYIHSTDIYVQNETETSTSNLNRAQKHSFYTACKMQCIQLWDQRWAWICRFLDYGEPAWKESVKYVLKGVRT